MSSVKLLGCQIWLMKPFYRNWCKVFLIVLVKCDEQNNALNVIVWNIDYRLFWNYIYRTLIIHLSILYFVFFL